MKTGVVVLRPLRDEADVRFCAGFLVASEPWITLGLTLEQAVHRLTDPAREIHVATVKEQITGVLVLFLGGTLKGYIQILAVHPDWRSRGVGKQIIAFAEEQIFRTSPNVFLCVSSFNTRAQRFYERLGYQRVGELTNFVVKGHAEFLMRKTRGPLRDFTPES
jgi:[ribosomal protein S18]-alanine N-acetyltransferase